MRMDQLTARIGTPLCRLGKNVLQTERVWLYARYNHVAQRRARRKRAPASRAARQAADAVFDAFPRAVGEAFCEDSLVWTRDSVIAGQQGNALGTSRPSGCELLEARTFLSASVTQVTPATLSHVSSDLVEQ